MRGRGRLCSPPSRRTGLVPRGALSLTDGERGVGELADIRTIVLAGMAGRDGWDAFAASPEASDGLDHPLDRWSRRVIEALARELGAQGAVPLWRAALFAVPAMGAARRTRPFLADRPSNSSRTTAFGTPTAARWASAKRSTFAEPAAAPSPCESCSGRWCLKTCPVGAFSRRGYDVAACAGHLKSAAGGDCMAVGCRARRACPVGAEHAYGPEQANFTMRAFLRGHLIAGRSERLTRTAARLLGFCLRNSESYAIHIPMRRTKSTRKSSRQSDAAPETFRTEPETRAGFFCLNPPQPIEKARFEKINASKRQQFY